MKHESKFNSEQQQQSAHKQEQQQGVREFPNVDALLRNDAARTRVPDGIAQRLRKSSAGLKPARSWWQRLFGQ